MNFKSKRGLGFCCKTSYILFVVSFCSIKFGSEKANAAIGGAGRSLARVAGSAGSVITNGSRGARSLVGSIGSGISGGNVNDPRLRTAHVGTGGVSSTSVVTSSVVQGLGSRLSSGSRGSIVSGASGASGSVSTGAQGGSGSVKVLRTSHKYGVNASNFDTNLSGPVKPDSKYVQFKDGKGKTITLEKSLSNRFYLLLTQDEVGRDSVVDENGKKIRYIYRSAPLWVEGRDIINAQGGDGTGSASSKGSSLGSIQSAVASGGAGVVSGSGGAKQDSQVGGQGSVALGVQSSDTQTQEPTDGSSRASGKLNAMGVMVEDKATQTDSNITGVGNLGSGLKGDGSFGAQGGDGSTSQGTGPRGLLHNLRPIYGDDGGVTGVVRLQGQGGLGTDQQDDGTASGVSVTGTGTQGTQGVSGTQGIGALGSRVSGSGDGTSGLPDDRSGRDSVASDKGKMPRGLFYDMVPIYGDDGGVTGVIRLSKQKGTVTDQQGDAGDLGDGATGGQGGDGITPPSGGLQNGPLGATKGLVWDDIRDKGIRFQLAKSEKHDEKGPFNANLIGNVSQSSEGAGGVGTSSAGASGGAQSTGGAGARGTGAASTSGGVAGATGDVETSGQIETGEPQSPRSRSSSISSSSSDEGGRGEQGRLHSATLVDVQSSDSESDTQQGGGATTPTGGAGNVGETQAARSRTSSISSSSSGEGEEVLTGPSFDPATPKQPEIPDAPPLPTAGISDVKLKKVDSAGAGDPKKYAPTDDEIKKARAALRPVSDREKGEGSTSSEGKGVLFADAGITGGRGTIEIKKDVIFDSDKDLGVKQLSTFFEIKAEEEKKPVVSNQKGTIHLKFENGNSDRIVLEESNVNNEVNVGRLNLDPGFVKQLNKAVLNAKAKHEERFRNNPDIINPSTVVTTFSIDKMKTIYITESGAGTKVEVKPRASSTGSSGSDKFYRAELVDIDDSGSFGSGSTGGKQSVYKAELVDVRESDGDSDEKGGRTTPAGAVQTSRSRTSSVGSSSSDKGEDEEQGKQTAVLVNVDDSDDEGRKTLDAKQETGTSEVDTEGQGGPQRNPIFERLEALIRSRMQRAIDEGDTGKVEQFKSALAKLHEKEQQQSGVVTGQQTVKTRTSSVGSDSSDKDETGGSDPVSIGGVSKSIEEKLQEIYESNLGTDDLEE